MKKKYISIFCLLMAVMLIPVMAAGSVEVSLNASGTTVQRGDEVTITVAAEVDSCKSGGIELSYDSGVFELVSGQWLISAFMSDFDTDTNDGVFAFTSAAPLTGDVFQFVLKVKDNCAIGGSTVSVKLTADGVSNTKTTVITVACAHAYDNACDADCNICGAVRTVTHAWDSGVVTKPATCAENGEKALTCTVCGKTTTQSIDKTNHTYVSEVTQNPTCTSTGVRMYTCTVCGESYPEVIAAKAHTYDNTCDQDCNVCGTTRDVTHAYQTSWSTDGSKHWHQCGICGARADEAAHIPGAAPTEWVAQTCTVCGYELQPPLGHTHEYEEAYTRDASGHWHVCLGCEKADRVESHVYDNACDQDCNVCGYERETEHTYGEHWSYDEFGHWHECIACGEMLELIPHIPGPEATAETDQTCTACGYVIVSAENHIHTAIGDFLSDESGHWQQCSCGEKVGAGEHSWSEGIIDETAGTVHYYCTVCGYPKAEPYQPGTQPSETTGNTSGTTQPTRPTTPGSNQDEPNGGSPWWILAIVVCVLLIGAIVFVIVGILRSRKKTGKYIN